MRCRVSVRVHACVAILLLTLVHQPTEASCGASFCMVNTNWNLQGFAPEAGFRVDLRYEYIKQDELRSGSDRIAFGQISKHHDEVRTINRNILAEVDYTINRDWGVSATVPAVDRDHSHVHNHRGTPLLEQWDFTRVGDVRVLGRRQWMAEDTASRKLSFYGMNFGLKLPTGDKDLRNGNGNRAERTLQPGTGTTDLLLGGHYSRVLPTADASWFVQALLQTPLNSREDYRPGRRVTLDVGYRYEMTDTVGLMLQLNALYRAKDSGGQAEPADTGGRFLFMSPGASFSIMKSAQLYGFVQFPIYQHVNGVQLTSDWSAVLGVSIRF